MALPKRQLLNPILVTVGVLTMASGLFMFFHFKSEFVEDFHEIVGLLFIAAVALHLTINGQALLKSLGAPWRQGLIVGLVIAVIVGLAVSAAVNPKRKGSGKRYQGPAAEVTQPVDR